MFSLKKLGAASSLLVLAGAGCLWSSQTNEISNFEECVAAGNPVMESYPRQCAANGKTYVEEIDEPIIPPGDDPACQNLCGDGSCQEVVCLAIGCPCAESASSCPQDCSSPEPIDDNSCAPKGSCESGEACPSGTECSGLPAYGCYPIGCPTPICLAENSVIDTPNGRVAVTAIKEGTLVWTMNRAGERVAEPVVRIGSMVAPDTHKVVHLVLEDGRELWVSPSHPTANGKPIGELGVGERLDGSVIEIFELVPYGAGRTYDLLPEGGTGLYWANGILLKSTLNP